MIRLRNLQLCFASCLALSAASCSGGGGGGGTTSFQVIGLSVQNGSVWQINREIVLTFSEPIDFSTVSANTINIRTLSDAPATGTFTLRDPRTVVFQPNCPTRDDLSDAGLQAGGVTYVLRIPGLDTSANTLRSTTSVPLGVQQIRTFSTPASTPNSVAFQDVRSGPPVPVVRAQGSADVNATYLEIGEDPDERVYFELDANQQTTLSEPGFEVPLNLYSDTATRVAVVLAFNQPVDPSANNISESRMRLEYRDQASVWHAIDTRVTLVGNCTASGAVVRLDPIGILPASSAFRAVVREGFQDLVGQTSSVAQATFAVAPTRSIAFTSLTPADALSDEMNESFTFGGDSPLSFEDQTALFDTPAAEWGSGRLSAAFAFDGTGGPGGDFDWVVRSGQIFLFDTTATSINGGPNGVPTTTINAVNGVVDVRNLTIDAGGEVRVQGPNPMRINATGNVRINGKLDVSGFAAKDVATLNTGNQVETGGAGAAGGGRGGDSNTNTSGPTLRGGVGDGPFRQRGLGGDGGEMSVGTTAEKNSRRPGGGGGGRFARDVVNTIVPDEWNSTPIPPFPNGTPRSMMALAGNNGNVGSRGAESGRAPAVGGQPGAGPFLDANTGNNFFGVKPVVVAGELTALVRGELASLWGGYGGGGGGNAGRAEPPAWSIGRDEKGGGGGGAAGGLHVKALGSILFGPEGRILANGARGATGENTYFLDHIGGTGGAGSGGHVILESATVVDFTDGGATVGAASRDMILAAGPPRKTGSQQWMDACCPQQSNGGAGGPGVIQIHVPNTRLPPSDSAATSDIIVPTVALATASPFGPLDEVCSPPAIPMIPSFGARSKARSAWISIGGADQKPSGPEGLVRFLFDGIETIGPDAGKIKTNGSRVMDRAPLLGDADLLGSATARILPDGFTLELIGAALDTLRSGTTNGISNDIYLRTPALLEDFALRMRIVAQPANREDYSIARAVYDEGAAAPGDEKLLITVSTERDALTEFNGGNLTGAGFQLLPRFFQVVTNGLADSLPQTAFVRLRFQAARDNGIGAPDETNLLVPWTYDISVFNQQPPGELQFFQYEVEFDLDDDALGVGADTEPVTLDFLKIPYVF